jgi:hypothetical protein
MACSGTTLLYFFFMKLITYFCGGISHLKQNDIILWLFWSQTPFFPFPLDQCFQTRVAKNIVKGFWRNRGTSPVTPKGKDLRKEDFLEAVSVAAGQVPRIPFACRLLPRIICFSSFFSNSLLSDCSRMFFCCA